MRWDFHFKTLWIESDEAFSRGELTVKQGQTIELDFVKIGADSPEWSCTGEGDLGEPRNISMELSQYVPHEAIMNGTDHWRYGYAWPNLQKLGTHTTSWSRTAADGTVERKTLAITVTNEDAPASAHME